MVHIIVRAQVLIIGRWVCSEARKQSHFQNKDSPEEEDLETPKMSIDSSFQNLDDESSDDNEEKDNFPFGGKDIRGFLSCCTFLNSKMVRLEKMKDEIYYAIYNYLLKNFQTAG
eukprot:UN26430